MTTDAPALAVSAEERDAVRHLLAAAKHLKDAEDPIGFAEVWSKNAELTIHSNDRQLGPLFGREAIMEFYRANWARGSHGSGEGRETHVAENPYVEALGEDRFRATHSAIFAAMSNATPILIGFGEFRDEIVKEDGQWRIDIRVSTIRRLSRSST
jgi:hypothetical protein